MSSKRVFAPAHHYEQTPALQPEPMDDGSGQPPNRAIMTDQAPRLPYCILVIDELPTVRSMVKACLEREGMLVFDFPDGAHALQWLEEKVCRPHVALLDIDAPQENWLPLVHHVRTYVAVVMALSCDRNAFARLQEHLIGVRESLLKPFLLEELLATVRRCLPVSKTL